MQIQSTTTLRARDAGDGSPPPAVLPALVTTAAKTDAASARPASSRKDNDSAATPSQAQRYNRWALMSYAQQKIADAQASEHVLTQTYRELRQVSRKIDAAPASAGAMAQQLRAVDARVRSHDNILDGALQPRQLDTTARRQQYVLDKIDLTSPKQADERVQMVFPASGRSASIVLPAASSDADVAARMTQALAGERVQVAYRDGRLVFSVSPDDKRKLEEPVLISGEGIRVPAGNPIPLKLQPETTAIDAIATALDRTGSADDVAVQQQKLQKLLRSIEGAVRDLQAYRERVMAQLERARQQMSNISDKNFERIKTDLLGDLGDGDVVTALSGLKAQANTTRNVVVALLNK